MTIKPKFLFDECFGKPAVADLKAFLGNSGADADFAHVLDFQGEGVIDDEWVPKLATDGWIVVSGDSGKKPSRGSKLPLVCRENNVTHVLLSGALQNSKTFVKIRAIANVWEKLLRLVDARPGSRHKLQLTSSGGARLVSPDP